MPRVHILILLCACLSTGGCASSHDVRDPAVPPATGFPPPDPAEWEYKTVTLEGPTMGDINVQLKRLNLQGWQTVNQHITVARGGLGYRVIVPLRRLK